MAKIVTWDCVNSSLYWLTYLLVLKVNHRAVQNWDREEFWRETATLGLRHLGPPMCYLTGGGGDMRWHVRKAEQERCINPTSEGQSC